jgi:hypothetical protein
MTHSSERTILLEMVSDKIISIKPKCRRNKCFFQLLTAGSILFSATITLMVGIDWPNHAAIQKNIALFLGLMLTLINGWMAVFDFKKLWMRQKSTLFGLYLIENELKILNDNDEHQERVKELFKTYQSVWEKDGREWAHIYSAAVEDPQKTTDI